MTTVLVEALKKLGYTAYPREVKKMKKKSEGFTPIQLAGIAVIIAAVWLVLDRTGVFNAVPEINQNMAPR